MKQEYDGGKSNLMGIAVGIPLVHLPMIGPYLVQQWRRIQPVGDSRN